MKKQEKSKIEASSILNSLQLKQNSKAFSKSSTEIILKCLKSNKLSIQNNLMKTKIENNIFHKLKSTFMPHCATDQRKQRRSLLHRGTRNKNFPLQKFWLKSQARITTTRKIFDLIETSFVISNFPNIETNTLYFLSRKWEGGNINWKSKQVLLCTIANWMTGQCTLTQLCQSTFMRAFVRIQFYFQVLKLHMRLIVLELIAL